MPSFITNSQFLVRFDYRWVAKNVLDDGTAPSLASLQDPLTSAGSVLASFIEESSDDVMAAAAIGKRYTLDDVTTYGGALLNRLTGDPTMCKILKRRGRATEDDKSLSQPYAEALQYLELLRRGERIFYAVPNVPEAGLPGTATMCPSPLCSQVLISQNERI